MGLGPHEALCLQPFPSFRSALERQEAHLVPAPRSFTLRPALGGVMKHSKRCRSLLEMRPAN